MADIVRKYLNAPMMDWADGIALRVRFLCRLTKFSYYAAPLNWRHSSAPARALCRDSRPESAFT
jgi:hypothetical protein